MLMLQCLTRPVFARAALAIATLCALSWTGCTPAEPRSGPAPGSSLSTFLPHHVTGAHAGRTACPLCVNGQQPAVAVWAREQGLADAARVAQALESALEAVKPAHAVGYVTFLPDADDSLDSAEQKLREAFENTHLDRVFLTIARPNENRSDVDDYRISQDPAIRTTTIVYVNRVAHAVHTNLGSNAADTLQRDINDARLHEEPYAEAAVAIAGPDEPGETISFFGQVTDTEGRSLPDTSIVAYQTDAEGRYVLPDAGTRVPRLRAVGITDKRGWYRFKTIRPGGYPGRDDPEHIHLTVSAPMHEIKYVTFWFEGDPRLTQSMRRSIDEETVIVRLESEDGEPPSFRHDIQIAGN